MILQLKTSFCAVCREWFGNCLQTLKPQICLLNFFQCRSRSTFHRPTPSHGLYQGAQILPTRPRHLPAGRPVSVQHLPHPARWKPQDRHFKHSTLWILRTHVFWTCFSLQVEDRSSWSPLIGLSLNHYQKNHWVWTSSLGNHLIQADIKQKHFKSAGLFKVQMETNWTLEWFQLKSLLEKESHLKVYFCDADKESQLNPDGFQVSILTYVKVCLIQKMPYKSLTVIRNLLIFKPSELVCPWHTGKDPA